jgi:subtilisin family serine protease
MKKFVICFLVIFMLACDKNELEKDSLSEVVTSSSTKVLTREEIDNKIISALQETGNFNWNNASDEMIFSALSYCNNILTVGYKSSNNDLKSTSIKKSKEQILSKILEIESRQSQLKSTEDILVFDDEKLVLVDVTVKDLNTVTALRGMEDIRYIEPAGYQIEDNSKELKSSDGFGCLNVDDILNTDDFKIYSPGCAVPWNFFFHNIPDAWKKSTGKGITIGLIDTGVSEDQALMGKDFNDGYSYGRSIKKYGVYIDSFWPWATKTDGKYDLCGHGTRMSSVMAAPRNNNYRPVGVAYNCNLVAYRASHDVFLNDYHEQKGVAQAFRELGDNSSVKIISMSMGFAFTINKIADAVTYAYSKGKLIFTAGGTSSWLTNNLVDVIFPASMSEVVAVTGIKDNYTYTQCSDCHNGSEIDFTMVMQRKNDSYRTVPVNGIDDNTKMYCGGSSIATAMTAGIAALVWSAHPSWTRSQVLTKMKKSAEFYPNRNSDYGYGCIDASAAVN